jgi:RimJ/RimL family protein N-acetyltransferase
MITQQPTERHPPRLGPTLEPRDECDRCRCCLMNADTSVYEFRVKGHLDDHWAPRLGDLTLTRNADGTTTLTGPVIDQAHLHGLLTSLRDIGAPLLSLQSRHPAAGSPDPTTRSMPEPVLTSPFRTERLTLRPARREDADATWQYRRLPSVGEWLIEIPSDRSAYQATFADPERLANTVVVELDGQLIGDFMLRVEDAWAQAEVADQARHTQAELGWVLDPKFTGHGYATEAVQGLLRVCFKDLGVRRVFANCFLANEASWRVMERVGMRRETHAVAESLHRTGRWLDSVAYAIRADEWPEG